MEAAGGLPLIWNEIPEEEMELTPEECAVLNIFKKHDIEKGEYLPVQTLDRERLKLPREIQDNWASIIKSLRNAGYIALDPLGYGLTEKGHHQVDHLDSD